MNIEQLRNAKIVKSILDKTGRDDKYAQLILPSLTFEDLFERLDNTEQGVIQALLDINPKDLGFMGPFIGLANSKRSLVKLPEQTVIKDGFAMIVSNQFLPEHVWAAFQELQLAIQQDIGKTLLVESGFRSPAHQAITFLTFLELFNFDIAAVARGVALPGYSQHGDSEWTAIDIMNLDSMSSNQQPQLFANTVEYDWLCKNAKNYNFVLSYPDGNQDGVIFEPWHWRYQL